jgi:hypothetical protein
MTSTPSGQFVAEKLEYIAEIVMTLSAKFDTFRDESLKEHQRVLSSIERAHTRIDQSDKDVIALAQKVETISAYLPWLKAIKYITVGLAVPAIIGGFVFIWQVIVHNVTVTVP